MTAFQDRFQSTLVEGHRLAYLDEGEGPPVLLIHGIPTSSLLWRGVIPALADGHRVIAPDLLNYGRSDKPTKSDVSIAAQARLLFGLLDGLGIRRTDLVSHDIGGGVAQIMAVQHPERIGKLVLSNAVCFDSWPIPEFEPLQQPEAEGEMTLDEFTKMLREFLPQGVHRPESLDAEAIELIMAPWSSEEGKRALFRNFRRLDPEYTEAIADELGDLDHETLILWGREDPFQKPAYAERLRAAIPRAELVWIEAAAHWIMEEKPDEVGRILRSFLDRAPAS
jgi:pimeloyl-ACP methyl ester carboxylesterase